MKEEFLGQPKKIETRQEILEKKAEEGPEISIETEGRLEQFGERKIEDIDITSQEIITSGEEQVKSVIESVDASEEMVAEIEKRGRFISSLRTIGEKVKALAVSTKDKIENLLGKKKAEEISPIVSEVAEEELVEEEVKVETKESTEKAEKREKERKESRELREWLEKEVYPQLGISSEDQERVLAEASPEKREILERSFQNIRVTTESYFEIETIEGRLDVVTYNKDLEKKRAEEIYPLLSTKLLEMGLGEDDLEKIGITKDRIDIGFNEKLMGVRNKQVKEAANLEKIEKEIEESIKSGSFYEDLRVEPIFFEILKKQENNQPLSEEEEKYIDELTEKTKIKANEKVRAEQEKMQKMFIERGLGDENIMKLRKEIEDLTFSIQLDTGSYKIRRSKEEVLNELLARTEEIKKNHFITLNIKPDKLMSAVELGRFKRVSELSEKERLQRFRELSGTESNAEFYSTQRNITEEATGTKDVIYGCYCCENGRDEIEGGAPLYGDIFLKFKPDILNRAVYFQGDSLAGAYTESTGRQLEKRNVDRLDYAEFAKKREISIEHAPIAKAIWDKERGEQFFYIEAAIIKTGDKKDLTVDDIESITVPLDAIKLAREEKRKLIDQLLEDPKLSNKIIILDKEGRRYKKQVIEEEMWRGKEKKIVYEPI
jgi:hypothetical protein